MAAVKRIRFGLVFEGARPSMNEFLKEIGITEAEGIQKEGKHFIVFTVGKPRRVAEVQNSVDAYNRRSSEPIQLIPFCDATVTTFERGNKFMSHPICQTIAQKDETYWAWSLVMAEQRAEQQMINDLEDSLEPAPAEASSSSTTPMVTGENPMPSGSSVEAPVSVEAPAPVEAPALVEAPVNVVTGKKHKKRAISELQMNLVRSVVVPSANKRSGKIVLKEGKENNQQVWNSCYGLLCIGMFPFSASVLFGNT